MRGLTSCRWFISKHIHYQRRTCTDGSYSNKIHSDRSRFLELENRPWASNEHSYTQILCRLRNKSEPVCRDVGEWRPALIAIRAPSAPDDVYILKRARNRTEQWNQLGKHKRLHTGRERMCDCSRCVPLLQMLHVVRPGRHQPASPAANTEATQIHSNMSSEA